MASLAFREVGVGLLNARRWKSTVWSHTAPGKPTLHSALWEQWAGSNKLLIGTTLWLMFPKIKQEKKQLRVKKIELLKYFRTQMFNVLFHDLLLSGSFKHLPQRSLLHSVAD